MVDEKGLSVEVADRIGEIVQLRGGTSRDLVKFDMTNEVRIQPIAIQIKLNVEHTLLSDIYYRA